MNPEMNTKTMILTDQAEPVPLVTSPSNRSRTDFPARPTLTRELAKSVEGLRCPHCGSIIYSRRHKLCGTCAQELPEQLLFPKEEAQRLEKLMRHEQLRHRYWMSKGMHQV